MGTHAMHTLALHSGGTMTWYEHSGCVAINGRLYFAPDDFFYDRLVLLQVVKENAVVHTSPTLSDRDPGKDYALWFWAELAVHPTAGMCGRVQCRGWPGGIFTQERPRPPSKVRFINELQPAFRRLQRWFKAMSRRRNEERSTAVLMALHLRLGRCSPMAVLCADAITRVLLHK